MWSMLVSRVCTCCSRGRWNGSIWGCSKSPKSPCWYCWICCSSCLCGLWVWFEISLAGEFS